MKLAGKVAIVTGSSFGIGKAIAITLAAEGASVVVNGRRSEPVERVVQRIKDDGGKVLGVAADITKNREVQGLVNTTLTTFGRVDIMVNNAGGTRFVPVTEFWVDIEEEDWDKTVELNLKGAFLCSKAVSKTMMEQSSGRIINISSQAGRRIHLGPSGQLPYNSSKAGLLGLTRALAIALGPYGITVNSVLPGMTLTEGFLQEWQAKTEGSREELLRQIPLRRLGKPEDVANVVAFLASDEGSYITGASIDVNGGAFMA